MTYQIICTCGTRLDLARAVNLHVEGNRAQPVGAPFYDADSREWCQAIMAQPASDEIRLREPERKASQRADLPPERKR